MPSAYTPKFRESLKALVEQFARNERHFLAKTYSEHQARLDFIDRMFEALGWQISLRNGENPSERDVIVERGATIGRPDYNFRIDGQTKFFVEAKAPHVVLSKNDILQAKKYAWNNTDEFVYFSVLTDFQEFRLYDASRKPDPKRPELGLIFAYKYTEYLTDKALSDIWQLSREAVIAGSLEHLISPGARSARAKMPLDKQFLSDLSSWRSRLLNSVHKAHPDLQVDELNSVVQVLLDRLVFIRIAEDRGALPPNRLREIARVWRDEGGEHPIAADLMPLFREINEDLNGEIFKPHRAESIRWDSKIIVEIIEEGLEPYNFAQIGVELLGSIYERYLGTKTHLTASRAKSKDDQEARKKAGVYYTPRYVVDFIVANTVGPVIEGKDPSKIRSIRIVDPACGSGSFLIAAYQYLLDYHLRWYRAHPKKTANENQPALFESSEGGKLSIEEKARILKNNIFGVDVDPQAIEIAMMSLYIKMLEGEKGLPQKKRLLPTMAGNIRCGNSLIAPQIREKALFDDDEVIESTNPFDWTSSRTGFGEIMESGGFDVVIGNPPYVRPHRMSESMKKMLWATYSTFVAKSDLYSCFMERGLSLTRSGGRFSFIVPQTWTSLESFTTLRRHILDHSRVSKMVQLPKKVFSDATVETCIFIFEPVKKPKVAKLGEHEVVIEYLGPDSVVKPVRTMKQGEMERAHLFNFQLHGRDESRSITDRMLKIGKPLDEYVEFVYGFKTADDAKYIHPTRKHPESKAFVRSAAIHRYWHEAPNEYVWYVPDQMTRNRRTARPGESRRFEAEKIVVSRMGKELVATYDPGGLYVKDAMLLLSRSDVSLKYVLGVLNSRLMTYFYREFFVTIDVLKNALLSLPVPPADHARRVGVYEPIVASVDALLSLYTRRGRLENSAHGPISRTIAHKEEALDGFVYNLFQLPSSERKTVETFFDDTSTDD